MTYLIYDMASGGILSVVTCPGDMLDLNVPDGCSAVLAIDGASDVTNWVEHETGAVQQKGDYILDALPLPCTITIEGEVYEVTEQPTFEFDVPGTYIIRVDAGPKFLEKEFTIDYQA